MSTKRVGKGCQAVWGVPDGPHQGIWSITS